MKKRYGMLLIVVVLAVVIANLAINDTNNSLVFAHNQDSSIVDKAPGDAFTVKITFKNTGETEGTWNTNIAFEDNAWSQVGTPQNLTLLPGQKETLVWDGVVPTDAPVGSVARLVVYYDDSFKALSWWIHVVQGAELCIKSSLVE